MCLSLCPWSFLYFGICVIGYGFVVLVFIFAVLFLSFDNTCGFLYDLYRIFNGFNLLFVISCLLTCVLLYVCCFCMCIHIFVYLIPYLC